jgi:hypothetical protein
MRVILLEDVIFVARLDPSLIVVIIVIIIT